MGDPFINALSAQDARRKPARKSAPKGGGGGGSGAASLRLIRADSSLNASVSRIQDIPRSNLPACIPVTASESKGGQAEETDPDEMNHHEFRVRKYKKFTQDWSCASKGLFRFKDKEDEEEHEEKKHEYEKQDEMKQDIRLLHLILRILLFYNALMQTPHPHFYSQIQTSDAFITEVGDTIHYSTPLLKSTGNLVYRAISDHDIDAYFNE